ncbi:MAG TPA: putative baseplate assembly protein [Pyrinomonadaceae bacterium]|nr:putative baseplate assembly protein [Pyrinomonadaceae bacterium]
MTCNCGCGGSLPCGCCEGVEVLTPAAIGNRPGLDAISYRVGTHGSFLETMKARLAGSVFSSLSGLKTRHTTDASIALLDAWATVGDVLTFYQERIANEGYLGTATERRSVLELARLVGYELRPGVAASVYLAYTLDKPIPLPPLLDRPTLTVAPPDPLVTIPEGSRAQSIPGPGELPQSFETSDDVVARSAWNNLQVRLSRPQKITADTRVIYFKGQPNLKPGDPLLIIASPPALFRIETVTPDPPNDRTKVTFRPWLESVTTTGFTESLAPAVERVVKRFSAAERFGVVPTSRSGGQVLRVLDRLLKVTQRGATAEEVKVAVEQEALPKLRELHQAAVSGRFTRVEPWVNGIVEALESALRGETAARALMSSANAPAVTDLTAILHSLGRARSIPPSDDSALPRSVPDNLGSTSDIAPQLLTSLKPELKPILYKAWANVPVTPAPPFEVYAFPARASAFGHNAPLEPIRNSDGLVTGAKEWDLQLPGATSTETFELIIGQEGEVPGVPGAGSGFRVSIRIDGRSTTFVSLAQERTTIDFTAANERVVVTLTRTGTVSTFDFDFEKRPIHVRVVVTAQGTLTSSLITPEPSVTVSAPVRISTFDISTTGRRTITGTGVTREEPRVLWLDAAYSQILPGSWVALEKPGSEVDSDTGNNLSPESTLIISQVTDVSERSRAEYGMTAKSTRLRIDADWINPTQGGDTMEVVRGTGIFAASERLELAEEPIETPISGKELELDGLYDELESGRWLILSGEREDVVPEQQQNQRAAAEVQTEAAEIQVKGVPATELVMLASVEQRYDENLNGDKTHTFLRLSTDLAYKYKRDTLIVYGNVIDATHGETRKETLGSGNASKSLQEFTLKQSPLTFVPASNPDGVESTLQVRVNDVLWHEAESLAELGPHDYRYIKQTDDADKTTVIFGTGEHGARLPTGPDNVTSVYRNGIGKVGNVKPSQISLISTQQLGVKGVNNPMAASGGADRESRDQARQNAPLAVMALDRLVSTVDYADFARTFAGIAKASAARLSDGQRRLVHLTVAGSDDIPIEETSDLYRNLNKALREFGDPHQPIKVKLRTFLLLVIEARIRVLPDYLFEKVEPKIRAALLDRFSFERRELGQDALLSDAMSTIQNVEGVAYVDVDKFDWIDEAKVVDHLAGNSSLGEIIARKERIPVSLAVVDPDAVNPAQRIKPAEIAYLSPAIPDTLILSEITS